jgi:hypothetical protein
MQAREFRRTLPKPSRRAKLLLSQIGQFVMRITDGQSILCGVVEDLSVDRALLARPTLALRIRARISAADLKWRHVGALAGRALDRSRFRRDALPAERAIGRAI